MLRSGLLAVLWVLTWAAPVRAQDPVTFVFEGTVALPDGSPAKGAEVSTIFGTGSSAAPWKKGETLAVDARGSFRCELRDSASFPIHFRAQLSDYPDAIIPWRGEIDRPQAGPIELRFSEPCYLVGHIESSTGELLIEGWQVEATPTKSKTQPRGPSSGSLGGYPDPDTGEFRLGPFPPGVVNVTAHSRSTSQTTTESLLLTAKEPTYVVLRGTDTSSPSSIQIVLKAKDFAKVVPPFQDAATGSPLVLLSPDGRVLSQAVADKRSPWRWAFHDVPSGTFDVELRAPGFEPRQLAAVSRGHSYEIPLVGSASLEVTVLNPDGSLAKSAGFQLQYPALPHPAFLGQVGAQLSLPGKRPKALIDLLPRGTACLARRTFQGLFPGTPTLIVLGEGHSQLHYPLEGLVGGEVSKLSLRLEPPRSMQGEVLDAEDHPVAGLELEFTRGTRPGMPVSSSMISGGIRYGPWDGKVLTDSAGRFNIPGLDGGPWTLRCALGLHASLVRTVDLAGPKTPKPIFVRLPELGSVQGRLRLPEGKHASSFELVVLPNHTDSVTTKILQRHAAPATIEESGAFALEDLPVGKVRFQIRELLSGSWSSGTTMVRDKGSWSVLTGNQDVAPIAVD